MESRDVLKKNKLKATAARCGVLEAILSFNGRHFLADEVCSALVRGKKNASRASTFRAIQLFHEVGILRMIEVTKSGCRFECVVSERHHDHLCCVKCGDIIEFTQDTIERLQARVCQAHGFEPRSHVLKITGVCAQCRKRNA